MVLLKSFCIYFIVKEKKKKLKKKQILSKNKCKCFLFMKRLYTQIESFLWKFLIICLVNVCYGKNIEKFYRINFNISIIRFFF